MKLKLSYVKPVFERLIPVVSEAYSPDGVNIQGTKFYEMEHNAIAAPTLSFDYELDNGLGLKANLFYLNSEQGFSLKEDAVNDDLYVYFNRGDGDEIDWAVDGTFRAEDELDVLVADIEAYRKIGNVEKFLTIGGGLRYVNMERRFHATESSDPDRFVKARHKIRGVGPKLSLGGKFPLYRDIGFYINTSGSLVAGNEEQKFTSDDGQGKVDDTLKIMPIFDAELGVEWTPDINFAESLTVRAGLEGQSWHGGGGWDFSNGNGGSPWFDEFSWGAIGGHLSAEVGL
ncbi:MAG: hypothetical protein BECKG1743D_GA0114223_100321 [Candidatus Kentron sp. G]|nr:MAG: hypothetical protein BECKG1743F_GA0114225_100352 [Candidatus Kentron sp. G]VFM95980.1 MAG: hypothetical protein BECKG1743E_GA0114224_100291 [Candidatus Kentron sp. G]VFM97816.1 MAG: hypothetical protein BECKG1743D_GA0114223_100321 [Candidatus Kentron sp. G]